MNINTVKDSIRNECIPEALRMTLWTISFRWFDMQQNGRLVSLPD